MQKATVKVATMQMRCRKKAAATRWNKDEECNASNDVLHKSDETLATEANVGLKTINRAAIMVKLNPKMDVAERVKKAGYARQGISNVSNDTLLKSDETSAPRLLDIRFEHIDGCDIRN